MVIMSTKKLCAPIKHCHSLENLSFLYILLKKWIHQLIKRPDYTMEDISDSCFAQKCKLNKKYKLIIYKRKSSRNIRSHLIHVRCDTTLILHSDKLLDEMHIYIVVSLKSFLIRRPILHYIKSFNYTSSTHPSHWNFQWKCKYP